MSGWHVMWLVVCAVLNKGRRVLPEVFGTAVEMRAAAARLPLYLAKCIKTGRLRPWTEEEADPLLPVSRLAFVQPVLPAGMMEMPD